MQAEIVKAMMVGGAGVSFTGDGIMPELVWM